eukprot:40882-Eustigmatos_ZCMA.PRE.1
MPHSFSRVSGAAIFFLIICHTAQRNHRPQWPIHISKARRSRDLQTYNEIDGMALGWMDDSVRCYAARQQLIGDKPRRGSANTAMRINTDSYKHK